MDFNQPQHYPNIYHCHCQHVEYDIQNINHSKKKEKYSYIQGNMIWELTYDFQFVILLLKNPVIDEQNSTIF